MFRLALILSLAVSSASLAETPDPKPLERRVEALESRVRQLERLLGVNAVSPTASTVSVAEAAPAYTASPQTCTGPGCSAPARASGGWYPGKRFGR